MSSNRWVFVDLFRFCAVILMLQGHTFDAYLATAIKQSDWFLRHHVFIHGFTGPIFLFSSGLAFGVATLRKWDVLTTWSPALKKRIRRYLMLLAIGYWLHLSYYSLQKILTQMTEQQVIYFFQVDALHIIGVTLMFMQFLAFWVKKKEVYIGILSGLFLLVGLATPFVWSMDKSNWPLLATSYLDKSTGSFFPILPWSMYLFAGTITAYLFTVWQRVYESRVIIQRLSLIGIFFYVIGKPGIDEWYKPFGTEFDGYVFLILHNLAIILWMVSILYALDQFVLARRYEALKNHVVLKTITIMGQETLAIYVTHLFLVYGSPLNESILPSYRNSLPVSYAVLYFVVLFISMIAYAHLWQYVKQNHPKSFRWFQYLGTAALFILFLINDWWKHII